MECTSTRLPYRQTGIFSKIALDYIDQLPGIQPFYSYPVNLTGIQQAITARQSFPTNCEVLVRELKKQYNGIDTGEKVNASIEALLSANTFTITTAHQNNIFTGPLYFIYKIVHTIRLADQLKSLLPSYQFVPVFYMGSEDADLDELNHIYLGGEKLSWQTSQTGAVGRMKIDRQVSQLIVQLEGQLAVLPHGNEIAERLKQYYREGITLQEATFQFVNYLFADYGLIVLLPDNSALKQQMNSVFKDDLLQQAAAVVVGETAVKLEQAGYKAQAHPREINLFYLEGDKRERITKEDEQWKVLNSEKLYSEKDILDELEQHPEKFSPNVILRGLYQETILPNIAFIGGAGETAYWLQLKELFHHYKIPFPVLVLRNSFLVLENKWKEKIAHLGFTVEDFFLPEQELLKRLVARESKNPVKLNGSLSALEQLYESFKKQAIAVDTTLEKHVEALKLKTVYRLQQLEKKMLRAEKRKYSDQRRQIQAIREHLFPGNGLQERKENLLYYYAKWGSAFIDQLYKNSPGLEQEFTVLTEIYD